MARGIIVPDASATTAGVVNTTSQTIAGAKTFSGGISVTNGVSTDTISATGALTVSQIATPSTPAAGANKIYAKADGFLYTLNPAGVELPFNKPVTALYRQSGTGAISGTIVFGSAVFDSTSSYNNTSGVFTCPVAGYYQVSVAVKSSLTSALVSGQSLTLFVNKNGSVHARVGQITSQATVNQTWITGGSVLVQLAVSDTLTITGAADATLNFNGTSTDNYFSIAKVG